MAAIATNAVSSIGGLYGGGTSLLGKSRILPTGITDWTWKYRQLPLAGTNLVDGDIRGVYAVEVMYTNVFITPIGNLLSNIKYVSGGGSVVPGQLYDAAFYGVITTQVPQSFVPLPPSGSIADSSSIKKAKRVHTVPGIPLAVHVTPGTGNNAATPAVPGHKVKTPKPGGFPGGGG